MDSTSAKATELTDEELKAILQMAFSQQQISSPQEIKEAEDRLCKKLAALGEPVLLR